MKLLWTRIAAGIAGWLVAQLARRGGIELPAGVALELEGWLRLTLELLAEVGALWLAARLGPRAAGSAGAPGEKSLDTPGEAVYLVPALPPNTGDLWRTGRGDGHGSPLIDSCRRSTAHQAAGKQSPPDFISHMPNVGGNWEPTSILPRGPSGVGPGRNHHTGVPHADHRNGEVV